MFNSALPRGSVVAALVIIVATVMSAQGPAGQGPQAGIPELLAEVRALRTELNRAAGTSMRMQLLVARLTLQEQRITTLDRQVAEVQEQLTRAGRERSDNQTRSQQLDGILTDGTLPAEDLRALAHEAKVLSTRLAEQAAHEQQLRAQEGELLGAIATEQSRWMDVNTRLDELERALPAPSR